jgi:23S rRNA (uracil1939-C5)-methyltransferase
MATFFTPTPKKSKSQGKNKAFELTIDAHDHAGNGLCLSSNPIAIVPDALIGERCLVRFSKQTKKANFAEISNVVEPSRLRTLPFCEYYEHCGGCSLQHTNAKHGLALKQKALKDYITKQLKLARTFSNSTAWEMPVLSKIDYNENPVDTRYRRRVRLALDARNKDNIKIGFRARRSDAIIDIPKCAIASSMINDCLPALRQALIRLPSIHRIGHIVITEGETALQVALFISRDLCKKSYAKLSALAQMLTIDIVVKSKGNDDICMHVNNVNGEISNKAQKRFPNSAVVIEDIPGVKLGIESAHFLQINKTVNQGLIKKVKTWLVPEKKHTLYDFYCGSGNFALCLAKYVGSVQGFEGVAAMVEAATLNASVMAVDNCHFSLMDLSASPDLRKLSFAENAIAILDPSREGALELCQFLASRGIEKIVYVSCNPNSFARDAQCLLPYYELSKIAALDMFPFTKHIEVMALFTLHK